MDLIKKYETIPTEIFEHSALASKQVAREIADVIGEKNAQNKTCVLGLATGSSPKNVYKELIKIHREEGLSFKNVHTFNLDEYYPMSPDSLQSYVHFMKEELFNHIDIPLENTHIPDGTITKEEIEAHCEAFEKKIEGLGGIDFQLLGIGGNGHIGFNEPGSLINSRTRLVALEHSTRIAAANDFNGLINVPRVAISMGMATIMKARRIVLLAWGEKKASIIKKAVQNKETPQVPASYLRNHPNTVFYLDQQAAAELTRVKQPWLVEDMVWNKQMIKKAVCQLALKLNKSILKLTELDYHENDLGGLLAKEGSAYDLNIFVFKSIQKTITGWPGGKPNSLGSNFPERSLPEKKRSLIFSPHPDDDIISMGGTFIRLHEQGHDVYVAYQTSGNIAVSDDEAFRYIDFLNDVSTNADNHLFTIIEDFLKNKQTSDKDIPELREIKGAVRRGEARATCRFVGIPEKNVNFMNLPFYETGEIAKKPLGKVDIDLTVDLIRKIKPHQIFAAGDLADPHGTHKVCLDAVFAAIEQLKHEEWMKDCWVWLYRGAWAEWDIHDIDMAVPMSPDQVIQKRHGIWKHQSQKDGVVFQGIDAREFWQRAEERNASTADSYNQLGLTEYAAIEAFVRYHF